jgi:hypothetical protein
VFRRFITAANIFTQICFPPNISGGLETAANPSCSTFYIPLRFRRFKTAANPEKTAANFILYYLNAGYVSDGKNRRKWPKTAANGSVGSWPPQILAGTKGNSCSDCACAKNVVYESIADMQLSLTNMSENSH